MHRRWFLSLGPRARQAYRTFRETELEEQQARDEAFWAAIDLEIAQEDLESATDEDDRADARDALAEAETALAQARREQEQAEADYTHWFQSDRRAKIWLGIDVIFGKVVGE